MFSYITSATTEYLICTLSEEDASHLRFRRHYSRNEFLHIIYVFLLAITRRHPKAIGRKSGVSEPPRGAGTKFGFRGPLPGFMGHNVIKPHDWVHICRAILVSYTYMACSGLNCMVANLSYQLMPCALDSDVTATKIHNTNIHTSISRPTSGHVIIESVDKFNIINLACILKLERLM